MTQKEIVNTYTEEMLESGTWVDYGFGVKPSFEELKQDVLNDSEFFRSNLYRSYKRRI